MLAIPKKSGPGLFQAVFGISPQRPAETEAVLTPFGMILIASRQDYKNILPRSLSDSHYLINDHEQNKILPETYRERVSLVSTLFMDETLQDVKTDAKSLSRHAYEHMYFALHEFGQFKKMFRDENFYSSVLHIARLWDGSHKPMGYTSEILRQAGSVMKWWKEAFLEAIVKDEIIAGLASRTDPRTLKIKLFFLTIDRFDSEFHSQLESFVSSHAQESFGDSRRYRVCMKRFEKKCDKINIGSYQEELKNRGISAVYKLLEAGIPLRVVLELAESLELKDWAEVMPNCAGR